MPYYPPTTSTAVTTTGSNVGTGEGLIFYSVTGSDLAFRTLLAGTNIQITTTTNIITISGPAGAGEANTASNVGTGAGQVYKSKTGVNLDLRNIAAGSNVNVTTGTNDITIGLSNTPTVDAFAMANLGSPPSNPATGYQWIYVTAGGAALFDASAQSYQILDGWKGKLTASTISTSISNASTGLVSATLAVGYYHIFVSGQYQSNTTTNGIGVALGQGDGTIAQMSMAWAVRQGAAGTAQNYWNDQNSAGLSWASASVVAANTNYNFFGHGHFYLSVRGTVRLEFRSEVASPSQVTINTGTSMMIVRI